MKTILFCEFGGLGEKAIEKALSRLGYKVVSYNKKCDNYDTDKYYFDCLVNMIDTSKPLYVFSINYLPIVAKACKVYRMLYISWIYDSPELHLYSSSVRSPYNRIFLFDRMQYERFHPMNPDSIYYMPLATEPMTSQDIKKITYEEQKKYSSEVVFVGSLYNEDEKRLFQSKQTVEENLEKIRQSIEFKHLMTLRRFNNIMEERENNLKKQQEKNKKKYEEIQSQIEKMNKQREKKNQETLRRQKKLELKAIKNEKLRMDKIMEKSKSQQTLYMQTKNRRTLGIKKMEEKFEKMNKEMEEKQEKLDKEKLKKLYDTSIKQEEDFIKQYQKKQSIIRLERINRYKTEKRLEELNEKEQKIEEFKKKKMELIENKAKLTGDMEKEKQNLINKFENTFKKKSQIDAQIVRELFPEDEELYNRIKKMTDKMYKTGVSFNNKSKLNDTDNKIKEKEAIKEN